jgi:glutamate-ammonia-ligase adenylyltransferase
VRKLIHWLTVKTHEGDLYEIDTALRPNGNAGLLVTPIEAYANYQQQRGSNTAWTWEHQAMTRARFVVGWPALQAPFDAVRRAVITAPRQAQDLKAEIVAMRDRVRQSHPDKPGRFDVKHSPGGMLDVEFVVQFLVLMHSAEQPRLADNVGNIALLLRAEGCGWLSPGMGEAAANAYKHLRALQHQARLNEQPGTLNDTDLQAERSAVLALWHYTLA